MSEEKKVQMDKRECKFFSKNGIEECKIIDSYEKISALKKIQLTVDFFRFKWGKWTIRLAFWGLSIVFIGAILNFYLLENSPFSLEVFGALQIWVSFILGIVATLFSIISMYLSFYNLELQKDSDKENREFLNEIKTQIVSEIQTEVSSKLSIISDEMKEKFGVLEGLAKDTQERIQESIKKDIKVNRDFQNFFK